jgi:uncharacterized coiled-coil protein SlyX
MDEHSPGVQKYTDNGIDILDILAKQKAYMDALDPTEEQLSRWGEVTGYSTNTIARWRVGQIRTNQSAIYSLWSLCTDKQLKAVEDLDIDFAAKRSRRPETRGKNKKAKVEPPKPEEIFAEVLLGTASYADDRISEQHKIITLQVEEINRLTNKAVEREEEIDRLNDLVDEREREIDRLNDLLVKLESRVGIALVQSKTDVPAPPREYIMALLRWHLDQP